MAQNWAETRSYGKSIHVCCVLAVLLYFIAIWTPTGMRRIKICLQGSADGWMQI